MSDSWPPSEEYLQELALAQMEGRKSFEQVYYEVFVDTLLSFVLRKRAGHSEPSPEDTRDPWEIGGWQPPRPTPASTDC